MFTFYAKRKYGFIIVVVGSLYKVYVFHIKLIVSIYVYTVTLIIITMHTTM